MREAFLRLPAAAKAATVILVAVLGDVVLPDPHAGNKIVEYGILGVCALPFLMPWSLAPGRLGARVLLVWLAAAAVVATARLVYLAAWFFPRRTIGIWLAMSAADLMMAAGLWLAVWAAWRRRAAVDGPSNEPLQPTSGVGASS
jgi:hypothetical protein